MPEARVMAVAKSNLVACCVSIPATEPASPTGQQGPNDPASK
ncbi:hypothetical protein [Haloechinothrix salitolerans]|uniref:Uncharacterized protein n=1 Tax=Haloechinothrix salitolerans TaxID=926830 RepID=A0ABW2C3Y9_9PSEU